MKHQMSNYQYIKTALALIEKIPVEAWKTLTPVEHSDLLAELAPGFSEVLRRDSIVAIAKEVPLCEARADRAKRSYQARIRAALWSVFVVTCSGALLLSIDTLVHESATILKVAVGVLVLAGGAVGSMSLHQIRHGRFFERWQSERHRSVSLRWDYSEAITTARPDRPPEGSRVFRLLQFEYFVRMQVNEDEAAYHSLYEKMERRSGNILWLGTVGVGLATVATAVAAILGTGGIFAVLAVMGVMAGALTSLAERLSEVERPRQLAAKAEAFLHDFWELNLKKEVIRKAIAKGSDEALPTYVAAAREARFRMHEGWREETNYGLKALQGFSDKLESELRDRPTERSDH